MNLENKYDFSYFNYKSSDLHVFVHPIFFLIKSSDQLLPIIMGFFLTFILDNNKLTFDEKWNYIETLIVF